MAHKTISNLASYNAYPTSADIVVVGAGMSGLYTSWRLLQESPDLNIVIVDKLDRTGGRLDSDLIDFDGQEVKEEEGGMRFTFDNMDDLMSLFMMLNIDDQIVPFPMNSGGNNRNYFRGHSFTNAESAEDNHSIWRDLYYLQEQESELNPAAIINTVFQRILDVNPEFAKVKDTDRTPEFWQGFRLDCQWKGIKMKDWSLWNLFTDMGYSAECITLLYRVSGFNGTFLSQMNGGVAYQLLEEFPSDPQFRTLKNGFSTLPNALVEQLGNERIYLKTQVMSINKGDTGEYEVNYKGENKQGNEVTGSIKAPKVILGLPKLALEKLFISSNIINELPRERSEALWNTLQTTTDQPLLKINLYYDRAWWGSSVTGQPSVDFGPNFSDLPLGSVYPFYAVDEPLAAALEYQEWLKTKNKKVPDELVDKINAINESKYKKPAALTIYCDYLNINFWKGLQHNGEKFTSPMQEKFNNQIPQTVYPASQKVVEQATEFFKLLFNTHYVPTPAMTSARIWSGSNEYNPEPSEQFGFGVHQWALHADDRKTIEDLVEPIDNLFICGEAYSDYQGWVEGALRSSDLVLKKGFNLEPISTVFQREHDQSPSDAIKGAYQKHTAALIRQYIDPDFEPTCDANSLEDDSMESASYGITLENSDIL